mmetsp:Transcript_38858/g.90385  ORF Transcript_38858/g.90385 Transcript_38858/m.90385 type:complete len:90 (+) Transcript_38858:133-402(+)
MRASANICIDYVLEVVELLNACYRRLTLVGPHDFYLGQLSVALSSTERMIHNHILDILAEAGEVPRTRMDDSTLMVSMLIAARSVEEVA